LTATAVALSQSQETVLEPAVARRLTALRGQMTYGFVLDFLFSRDSIRYQAPFDLNILTVSDTADIRLLQSDNPDVSEAFQLGGMKRFTVYRGTPFSGTIDYFLLAHSSNESVYSSNRCDPAFRFDLFRHDLHGWIHCDSFVFTSRFGGDFRFLTINTRPVIRIRQADDRMGYYREDEAYLDINADKFRTLFGFSRIEINARQEERMDWLVGYISFVDLDGDGLRDIVHREREGVPDLSRLNWSEFASTQLWLRLDDSADFFKVNLEKTTSNRTFNYLFRSASSSFERAP
jgi:hypothetical protein